MNRLLGEKHEEALISANNLAVSLWQCGQRTGAEQLLRGTLALCQRALGPARKQTHALLRITRSIGLTTCLIAVRF